MILLSAALYGISVHFKIYPIIYAVPIWFGLDSESHQLFTRKRIAYGLISFGMFMALNFAMFRIYGQKFIDETYLYHIVRKDHRHNFSFYFYRMYLQAGHSMGGSILSFLPQMVLVAVLGYSYSDDQSFAWFLQTFAFVMMNKVCTSQYFMWFLNLLPLVLPSTEFLGKQYKLGVLLLFLWVLGQAFWLYFAFGLEHLGENTFIHLWQSSMFFYIVQVFIVICFIRSRSLKL
jgi:phosphatidylinositol glycan class M